MPEYRQAQAAGKRSYKKLGSMMIEKAANGGHNIMHHQMTDGVMAGMKNHAFGKEDAADGTTHAHIMEHLGKMGIMPGEAHAEEHEGPMSQVEAASEPASENVNA